MDVIERAKELEVSNRVKRMLQKTLACSRKVAEDWRDYKLRKGWWFMKDPIFIQVETTNRCNLDCIMCDIRKAEVGIKKTWALMTLNA